MKLLLDEMFPPSLAEQLRARGHDVVSLHEPDFRHLEGMPDADVYETAMTVERALVTENVADFARLEVDALSRGISGPTLIFTTDRHFPRGHPGTLGRLVVALDVLLCEAAVASRSIFLKASD